MANVRFTDAMFEGSKCDKESSCLDCTAEQCDKESSCLDCTAEL